MIFEKKNRHDEISSLEIDVEIDVEQSSTDVMLVLYSFIDDSNDRVALLFS